MSTKSRSSSDFVGTLKAVIVLERVRVRLPEPQPTSGIVFEGSKSAI